MQNRPSCCSAFLIRRTPVFETGVGMMEVEFLSVSYGKLKLLLQRQLIGIWHSMAVEVI